MSVLMGNQRKGRQPFAHLFMQKSNAVLTTVGMIFVS